MHALEAYRRPRDKVTSLLRERTITRIKKGLYVSDAADSSHSAIKEVLANIIYGPSYISLQYALHLYGMIPEYAVQVTSVTFKKTKRYQTPAGAFVYRSVPRAYYVRGVVRRTTEPDMPYLVASREKALMDMLYFAGSLRSMRDVQAYLLEDLRIDIETIQSLDIDILSSIAESRVSKNLSFFVKAVRVLMG